MSEIDRGAKLDRLKQLYETFRKKNDEVSDLITLLDSLNEESEGFWKGPGADNFRKDWRSFKPHVKNLANSLHDAHLSAKNSHDRIDDATRA